MIPNFDQVRILEGTAGNSFRVVSISLFAIRCSLAHRSLTNHMYISAYSLKINLPEQCM